MKHLTQTEMNNIKNTVDLHIHTTASDGSDSPARVVKRAKSLGLEVISITDHDTVKGLTEAMRYDGDGIRIITGIEFSCHRYDGEFGFDCHILGYGFDPENEHIKRAIEHGREMRFAKLEARIRYLVDQHGIVLDDEEIEELRSYNSVAKPHLARVLIKRKLASSVGDAIDRYLKGAKFPDDRIDAREAIDAIHAAGGVAIYAHPLGGEREPRIGCGMLFLRLRSLKKLGINGVEAYYSRYDEKDRSTILSQAADMELLVSSGSDYHGENKTVRLGELSADGIEVSRDSVTLLRKLTKMKKL